MTGNNYKNIRNKIKSLYNNEKAFFEVAKEVYDYQRKNNIVFRNYISLLGRENNEIHKPEDFVFLPISNFKERSIQTGEWNAEKVFESSGTTGSISSKHLIRDEQWYLELAQEGFEKQFGSLNELCVLALLPGYLERENSSLVFMANHFILQSKYAESGFYLDELEKLSLILKDLKEREVPTILLGVSFALIELGLSFPLDFPSLKIMETGGMKGRAKEMTRPELHQHLRKAFGVDRIFSEYGMTELQSQAYLLDGSFIPNSSMQVLVNEFNDPFKFVEEQNGQLNIIDLANLDSCSFIQTEDIGKKHSDGSFNVLGRLDTSDLRGCNLMYLS